jgi:predicted permease
MVSYWLRRLRARFRRDRLDDELRDEMSLHVELRALELEAGGMTPAEARAAARRRFGNETRLREESRAMWELGPLDSWVLDLRYAGRTMRRMPAFTAVIVLSLAIGLGATTALFSLVDAVMLRRLPVANPDELVLLADEPNFGTFSGVQSEDRDIFSYPEFRELRVDSSDLLAGIFATSNATIDDPVRLAGVAGSALPATGALASGGYFPALEVEAAVGRVFTESDDTAPGASPVAVLSHRWWARRFDRDPGVLGQTLLVNGVGLAIIGVARADFEGERVGGAPDYWVPLSMQATLMPGRDFYGDRHALFLQVLGRLRPDVSPLQVRERLTERFRGRREALAGSELTPEARRDFLDHRIGISSAARGLSTLRGETATRLLVLMGLSVLVLLLAVVNVAGLLTARAAARRREIGMRLAIGAGAGRLVRQLVVESLLLALAGGALGIAFARWGARSLLALSAAGSASAPLDPPLDLRVFGFAAAVSVGAGLVFGILPALQATRVGVVGALQQRPGQASRRHSQVRRHLVVGQVAISLLLVAAAGLFALTIANLRKVDVGYDRNGLIVARFDVIRGGYAGSRLMTLARDLESQVSLMPGVAAVALSENGLFNQYDSQSRVIVEGREEPAGHDDVYARFDRVGAGYFRALGIPLLAGRALEPSDKEGAPTVAVVNATMARQIFGDERPIGRRFRWGLQARPWTEVVGVVGDTIEHDLRSEHRPRFYLSYVQGGGTLGSLVLEVRARGDVGELAGRLRALGLQVDSQLPERVSTLDDLIGRTLAEERALAVLAALFGLVAVLLAALGLYGIVSYNVAQRTGEIGVRMALGARPGKVLKMVLRETLMVGLAGTALGVLLAAAGSRMVESQLFGLDATDLRVLVAAALVILAVAAISGLLPAIRAARVDPLMALRAE